jgi:hypothetical protein
LNVAAALSNPIIRRGKTAAPDEREQSSETSRFESEEASVGVQEERECLTQGRRFTESFSGSGRVQSHLRCEPII